MNSNECCVDMPVGPELPKKCTVNSFIFCIIQKREDIKIVVRLFKKYPNIEFTFLSYLVRASFAYSLPVLSLTPLLSNIIRVCVLLHPFFLEVSSLKIHSNQVLLFGLNL